MKVQLIKQYYNKLSPSIKASFWFTVCSIVQRGIALITVPIFTRILSKEEYGEFSLYQSWYQVILIISTLNLAADVLNNVFTKYSKSERYKIISSFQSLATLIVMCCIILVNTFYSSIHHVVKLPLFVINLLLVQCLMYSALKFWTMEQRYDYKYIKLVIVTIVIAILNPLLGLLLVHSYSEKGLARIISVCVIDICFGVFFYLYNLKKGRLIYNREYWRYGISFNLPLLPNYLSGIILGLADRIMIGYYCSNSDVAIYSVAYAISIVMNIVTTSINASLIPWIYKSCKNKNYKAIKDVSTKIILIVALISLIPSIFAPEIIYIMGSSQYMSAIWVVPSISSSVYIMFVASLYISIQLFFESKITVTITSVTAAVANLVLNYFLIPKYGFIVAGYTTLVSYIIYLVLHYVFNQIICKKEDVNNPFDNRIIIISTLIFLVVLGILTFGYMYSILRYSIIVFTVIILFIGRNKILKEIKSFISLKKK
ncbi:Membrane protein involved in the export of O-antigen and teichoic acid [Ruminococcus sp. YE71]|uniref:lipopolysaccharide biosynthesis protein n=1 Tax=unclassified Ruminococcus TaxID=2608920 RepID=UPI00087FC1FB|nr:MULTISPECIES: oligosaccharide flippase family protein [unclassified Ruminococcus]SDA30821.1 Membrane protein involved in the export of O-antigen and teichoic acid [Ruminococcus sp. YE78]SFW50539.1 Membrane protein involved in the export of O-antigen and teichoic acid [Ruminococcus sp. YE71]